MFRQARLLLIAFAWACAGGAHATESVRRPLVVVAGILGSKLCTSSGEVVWGTGSSLQNFARLELGGPSKEALSPCGLIDKVEVFGPFYSIKAYAALLTNLKSFGFDQSNLHLFDYDWRQSNFETAAKFKTFIEERQKDGRLPGKFDILAHSMGGIVTRIYLDKNPDNSVNKVIYFGTPFLGSADTLSTLSEGWGRIANIVAGGMDTIRRVAISLPGFMELLPRYKECCYVRLANNDKDPIDVFDAEQWRLLHWLPNEISSSPERLAAFKTNLNNARTLSDLLRTPPPKVSEVIFAGDAKPTNVYFAVKQGATAPDASRWYFSKDLGDGTVPAWSAARNPNFDDLSGAMVSFSEHATLFDDNWAESELKRELLSITPVVREPINGRGHPIISVRSGGTQLNWTIRTLEVTCEQPTYANTDMLRATATINVDGPVESLKTGLVLAKTILRNGSSEIEIPVAETSGTADFSLGRLTFSITADLSSLQKGAFELEFSLPTVRDDAKSAYRFAVVGD